MSRWMFRSRRQTGGGSEEKHNEADPNSRTSSDVEQNKRKPPRWSLGILQDKETDEVPGSILLMSKVAERNEPLGLQHIHARTSSSSLPSPYPPNLSRRTTQGSQVSKRSKKEKPPDKKLTADGKIILEPQPDDSLNDPLNWPAIRRDLALLSLGMYCMLGGGMTPVLAAGFSNVATSYHISTARVSLTTGLYMMGLGIGSVIMSPTAILFGKRPVYLFGAFLFIVTSVWCALSPNFTSLILARIFMGIAVSPVECLPSATIAEIFFLHERAYRLGIYTLLLLGGKNLIPLVSAAIINALGWRWVFWIVAMVVGFCAVFVFLFVPETFWDRTPRPRRMLHRHDHPSDSRHSLSRIFSSRTARHFAQNGERPQSATTPGAQHLPHARHVGFADGSADSGEHDRWARREELPFPNVDGKVESAMSPVMHHDEAWKVVPSGLAPPTPLLHNLNSPFYEAKSEEGHSDDYFSIQVPPATEAAPTGNLQAPTTTQPARRQEESDGSFHTAAEQQQQQPAKSGRAPGLKLTLPPKALSRNTSALDTSTAKPLEPISAVPSAVLPSPTSSDHTHEVETEASPAQAIPPSPLSYTAYHREAPAKSYIQTLLPYSGRLSKDKWWKVAIRPFVLYAYPSILWSAMVYSLSVGWLIVLSESVTVIYRDRATYNFTALQVGLVYISPFIGGVLGTAVAGKVSDLIVRAMARRNDGIYEPEFRLVMAGPIAVTTVIGLMGFGWSAQEHDMWFVPTFFFGVISFGCCLGSTTAITFAVDCYRGYAGEALVTLNFSKNIFHGLVFSLFFTSWLESDGAKEVFLIIGGIQLALMLLSIPMYIFGKRARMWTVRKDLMERLDEYYQAEGGAAAASPLADVCNHALIGGMV